MRVVSQAMTEGCSCGTVGVGGRLALGSAQSPMEAEPEVWVGWNWELAKLAWQFPVVAGSPH